MYDMKQPNIDRPCITIPRLARESAQAHSARRIYWELGADRSLHQVRQLLGKPQSYQPVITRWATMHEWAASAQAYDQTGRTLAAQQAQAQHLADITDYCQRYRQLAQELRQVAARLLARYQEQSSNQQKAMSEHV